MTLAVSGLMVRRRAAGCDAYMFAIGGAHLKILRPVHLLPEGANIHGVTAYQKLCEVLDGPRHGELATGHARLTPAVDQDAAALGGALDLDEEHVAAGEALGRRIGLYGGDQQLRRRQRWRGSCGR